MGVTNRETESPQHPREVPHEEDFFSTLIDAHRRALVSLPPGIQNMVSLNDVNVRNEVVPFDWTARWGE
jgi:hypothetical protein